MLFRDLASLVASKLCLTVGLTWNGPPKFEVGDICFVSPLWLDRIFGETTSIRLFPSRGDTGKPDLQKMQAQVSGFGVRLGDVRLMSSNAHHEALALQAAMPVNGKPKDTCLCITGNKGKLRVGVTPK